MNPHKGIISMLHVWKKSSSSANEIHYVQIERKRVNPNDQGGMPTTREITLRPEKEEDVQTRAEPTKPQGKGRSQRSGPKPSPNTIGRLKGPKRHEHPTTLGQTLDPNPQAQAKTYSKVRLVHTCGANPKTKGQTLQGIIAKAWLDITREGELKSKERSS